MANFLFDRFLDPTPTEVNTRNSRAIRCMSTKRALSNMRSTFNELIFFNAKNSVQTWCVNYIFTPFLLLFFCNKHYFLNQKWFISGCRAAYVGKHVRCEKCILQLKTKMRTYSINCKSIIEFHWLLSDHHHRSIEFERIEFEKNMLMLISSVRQFQ